MDIDFYLKDGSVLKHCFIYNKGKRGESPIINKEEIIKKHYK